MNIVSSCFIYENPLPQLRSRHAYFPNLCVTPEGVILAASALGEAFESVDMAVELFASTDGGRSFAAYNPRPVDTGAFAVPVSTCAKLTVLAGGDLLLLGYGMLREDSELPISNAATGGVLPSVPFFCRSGDGGRSFSPLREIPCRWGRHVEASAPVLELPGGEWITPIAGFPDWDGNTAGRHGGRILRSRDAGASWDDGTVCMAFENPDIACYEQRICRLDSGRVVCIAWNHDLRRDEPLPNHYSVSGDGGRSFSAPRSTGILGQASSVCAVGGERLLALHALRRGTDRPGIYGYLVNLQNGDWDIEDELVVWEPQTPVLRDSRMADVFAHLRFGQPGAILSRPGEALMSHWCIENGQGRTLCTRIAL